MVWLQVVITDEEIERDVLEAYRPLTSPDGVNDWTTHGEYSVVFRRMQAQREVWVETSVTHFSVKSNAKKIDKGAEGQSYYYGDLGGRRWWFRGQSSVPVVHFGNNTKASDALFLCGCLRQCRCWLLICKFSAGKSTTPGLERRIMLNDCGCLASS